VIRGGLAALIAATLASNAVSQDRVAGWQLGKDGDSCAMLRLAGAEGGPAVRLDLAADGKSALTFFVPGSGIAPDYFYAGALAWDDKIWPLHLVSAGAPEMPALLVQAPDDRLVAAVERNDDIAVQVFGVTEPMTFPLTGAKEAIVALRACRGRGPGK